MNDELLQQELPLLSEAGSSESIMPVKSVENFSHIDSTSSDLLLLSGKLPSAQQRDEGRNEVLPSELSNSSKEHPLICPQCRAVDRQAQAICRHCGFSMQMADQMFSRGSSGVLRVELFNDDVHCLRLSERQVIEERLEQLALNLAPFFVSIYVDSGLEDISLSTMGFWLLNRAQFFQAETRRHATDNASGILLLIDAGTGLVSLSLGYRAEQVISHERAKKMLSISARFWQQGQYARSLNKLIDLLELEIRRYGRHCAQSQSNRRVAI